MTARARQRVASCDYSDEQLRAAWCVCKLPTWPASFEEAMADQLYSRLVRLNAGHLEQPRPAMVRPLMPPRRMFLPPLPAGWVDHKRAAAGDRDD
jgi:hypothetical protein